MCGKSSMAPESAAPKIFELGGAGCNSGDIEALLTDEIEISGCQLEFSPSYSHAERSTW
jgi:hypothetical protein